jgi:3-oxoacyl-[acyl-carrier protein] reductase
MDDLHEKVCLVTGAVVPWFRGQGSGTIINTTSVAARHGGGPGALVYAAAKAAVNNLTRGLAKELAPHRIRVNAISPGVVLTPIHERLSNPGDHGGVRTQRPAGAGRGGRGVRGRVPVPGV